MRLHTKIFLLIIASTFAVGMGTSYLVGQMMYKGLDRECKEQAQLIVQSLVSFIDHNMNDSDADAVDKALKVMVQLSKKIQYAYVIDHEGLLFAQFYEGAFPDEFSAITHQHAFSTQSPVEVHHKTKIGRIHDIAYPLIEGRPAHVHIGTDEEYLYNQVSELHRKILIFTISLMALSTVFGIITSRHITRPLAVMSKAMINFGKGKEYGALSINGDKDMNTLTQAFNQMIEDLEEVRSRQMLCEERFRGIFEHIKSGVAVYEAVDDGNDFIFLDFNSRGEQLENIQRKNLLGRRLTEAFPDVNKLGLLNVMRKVWKTGKPEHHPRALYEDDKVTSWRENFVYRISNGEVVVVYEDVTERMQMEVELKHSRQLMQMVIDAFPQSMMVINRDYSLAFVNKKVCDLSRKQDLVESGITCHEVYHHSELPCSHANHPCPLERVVETKKPMTFQHVHFDSEGLEMPVEILATPIFDNKGEVIQIIESCRDVSHQQQLIAQLNQAQKMESVGRLAGGVAHDFNNMLAVILGNIEMALMQVDTTQEIFSNLQEVRSAAIRSSNLTRQLLAFARKQVTKPRVLDLNETIESMLKMLRRLIGENIKLAWIPGDELWSVLQDASQIDQILVNLSVNSRDAIKENGEIAIKTRNETLSPAYCAQNVDVIPGDYVLLEFSDNGIGMDSDTLKKIKGMEPD